MTEDDDATQEGVSEEEKTTAEIEAEVRKNPQLSRREEMINFIHGNLETERAKEIGIEPEKEPEKSKEKSMAEKAVEEEVVEEQVEKKEETIKLKIDGMEQDVPISKIVETGKRALQKELASDKRLEEATRILKEAKEISVKNQLPLKKDTDDTQPHTVDAPDFKTIVKAIQYGEEDEAAKALENLIQTVQVKPQIAPPLIDVRGEVEKVLFNKEVWDTLHKPEKDGGFKEIMDIPMFANEIVRRTNEALLKGEPNTVELYVNAAASLRSEVKNLIGPTEEKVEKKEKINTEERRERKLKAESVSTANAVLKSEKEPEPTKSVSDIIAEIRKARHQS